MPPRINPWVVVSAADYEGHMGEEGLDLLGPLSVIFRKAYLARLPRRLLVVGVSTGNGLEHVNPLITGRTVGIDVNLSYLAVTRQRFMNLGAGLELMLGDAEKIDLSAEGFDLVHAALVLEYLDLRIAVPRLASWTAPGGACTVVLEMPGPKSTGKPVTAQMGEVADVARMVPMQELREAMSNEGLVEKRAFVVPLRQGINLFIALYEKPADHDWVS